VPGGQQLLSAARSIWNDGAFWLPRKLTLYDNRIIKILI
jgi:hypothetical protein